jgi:hypothetical protein
MNVNVEVKLVPVGLRPNSIVVVPSWLAIEVGRVGLGSVKFVAPVTVTAALAMDAEASVAAPRIAHTILRMTWDLPLGRFR